MKAYCYPLPLHHLHEVGRSYEREIKEVYLSVKPDPSHHKPIHGKNPCRRKQRRSHRRISPMSAVFCATHHGFRVFPPPLKSSRSCHLPTSLASPRPSGVRASVKPIRALRWSEALGRSGQFESKRAGRPGSLSRLVIVRCEAPKDGRVFTLPILVLRFL